MKLGFVGTGKISSAVVEGLCSAHIEGLEIKLSPRGEIVTQALAQAHAQVERCQSNQQVLDESEVVVLAVRPDDAMGVVAGLKFRADHEVISFVPFLLQADLERAAAPARHCCRAIPLPTVVHHQCPTTILHPNQTALDLFGAIGQPLLVDNESQLHTLWTLTGLISPLYDWMDGLSQWSVGQGVTEELSRRFVVDMVQALAYAAQQSDPLDFQALSHHAATPGGMNEQAASEIANQGSHKAYALVLDRLLERFPNLG